MSKFNVPSPTLHCFLQYSYSQEVLLADSHSCFQSWFCCIPLWEHNLENILFEINCKRKRNFKWPSMQTGENQIYNGRFNLTPLCVRYLERYVKLPIVCSQLKIPECAVCTYSLYSLQRSTHRYFQRTTGV